MELYTRLKEKCKESYVINPIFRKVVVLTEAELNALATTQLDERELLISKFDSELATLHQNQFAEFRQVGTRQGCILFHRC